MKHRQGIVFAIGFTVTFLLFGCGLPATFGGSSASSTPAQIDVTPIPIEAISPTELPHIVAPPATAQSPGSGSCTWVWANQDLSDLTDELNRAFEDAGFAEVEIRASAYGENCLDPQTNKVIRFAAMQTDYYLVIPVKDTADHQATAEWIVRGLKVLEPFVPGRVPGPNPGSIGMRFVSAAGEENLWFQRTTAENLVDSGKTGAELYDALH